MSPTAGQLVTETFNYDGGRQVTAYIPPAPPESIVFAGDGGWHTSRLGEVIEAAAPSTMIVGVHGLADDDARLQEYSPVFDAERFAAAKPLTHVPCAKRSNHRAHKADSDGQALVLRSQSIQFHQCVNCTCDDNRVESEQQSPKGSGKGGFDQVGIWPHSLRSLQSATILQSAAHPGKTETYT